MLGEIRPPNEIVARVLCPYGIDRVLWDVDFDADIQFNILPEDRSRSGQIGKKFKLKSFFKNVPFLFSFV